MRSGDHRPPRLHSTPQHPCLSPLLLHWQLQRLFNVFLKPQNPLPLLHLSWPAPSGFLLNLRFLAHLCCTEHLAWVDGSSCENKKKKTSPLFNVFIPPSEEKKNKLKRRSCCSSTHIAHEPVSQKLCYASCLRARPQELSGQQGTKAELWSRVRT